MSGINKQKENCLSATELRGILGYDSHTGVFTWVKGRQGIRAGAVAGCLKKGGYLHIRVNGRVYLAHRLAWLYVNGAWPSGLIDHINRHKTDNRLFNLRVVTQQENLRNSTLNSTLHSTLHSNNTSGVNGVISRGKKWCARISFKGNLLHLGLFDTLESATLAREEANKKYGFHKNHGRK